MANNTPHKAPDNTGKKYERTVHDPRQAMFKTFYLAPTSTTFMNIYQSAIRAGYSEQYAANISTQKPAWWVELTASADHRRAKMLDKAEGALESFISDNTETKDAKDRQLKASTFVSERLGKEHYSSRTELTDKGGRKLFTNQTKSAEDTALEAMFLVPASKSDDA